MHQSVSWNAVAGGSLHFEFQKLNFQYKTTFYKLIGGYTFLYTEANEFISSSFKLNFQNAVSFEIQWVAQVLHP